MAAQALPFIGIVPAKKILTMTPAEAKAEDLYIGTLPSGSRTQEQADHAQLISHIKSQLRQDPGAAGATIASNAAKLRTTDFKTMFADQVKSQIVIQTEKLTLQEGMSVFDLGTSAERAQLQPILMKKLATMVNTHAIDPAVAPHYAAALTNPR